MLNGVHSSLHLAWPVYHGRGDRNPQNKQRYPVAAEWQIEEPSSRLTVPQLWGTLSASCSKTAPCKKVDGLCQGLLHYCGRWAQRDHVSTPPWKMKRRHQKHETAIHASTLQGERLKKLPQGASNPPKPGASNPPRSQGHQSDNRGNQYRKSTPEVNAGSQRRKSTPEGNCWRQHCEAQSPARHKSKLRRPTKRAAQDAPSCATSGGRLHHQP